MPTDKKQAKTPEQLMNIISQLQAILEKNVTKQELFELGNALASLIKELQKQVDVKIEANKDLLTFETKRIGNEVSEYEKRIREIINTTNKQTLNKLSKEVEQKVTELSTLIGFVEDKISIYNDAEVREMIDTIQETMPEAYNDEEVKKEIEELEMKYGELERKIKQMRTTNGGGVTNARIQQAFKYILKTEQPSGSIDGVNTTFTVSSPVFAVLGIVLNGETVAQLPNYTISGKSIVFSSPIPAVYSGKDFEIKYV